MVSAAWRHAFSLHCRGLSLTCLCATSAAASPAQQIGHFHPDMLNFSQENFPLPQLASAEILKHPPTHLKVTFIFPELSCHGCSIQGRLGEKQLHVLSSSRWLSATCPQALSTFLITAEITPTDSQKLLYPWRLFPKSWC